MKKRMIKSLMALAMGVLLAGFATSCNPEHPENEKVNKLHEDPMRAVFTLQEGTLSTPAKFDATPKMADFKASSAPVQVIEWQTTPAEGWHVTSTNSKFSVKNAKDNPNVVYLLKMEYYNAKNELINDQFFNLGQDKIHQHFFSMFKQVEYEGKQSAIRITNKAELPYDYRYADELNGTFIGDTNPMGFQGFIKFVKPGRRFALSVDLLHAAVSKFDDKGEPSPFYLPAKTLLSTGLWDINVKLPVEIDGQAEGDDALDASLFKPAKVEIAIYEGHLHGPSAFHQNPVSVGNKCIGRNYRLTYTLQNGKWVADRKNPKCVNLIGTESREGASAFSIRYFDKEGNDITDQIIKNGEDKHYQHFFTLSDIQPSYGGIKEETDKSSTDFFDYTYCDTDPWNKTHKFDNAKFTGTTNPIGVKGYFKFFRTHKRFNLEIKLMRAHDSKFVGGKASSFCAPTAQQLTDEAWMPAIVIPMNIYMDSSELDLEADLMVDDLNDVSTKESDFSKKDLRVLHSLMDAFDVDFKTAVSEFWWNLNGERKEDNSGFWF